MSSENLNRAARSSWRTVERLQKRVRRVMGAGRTAETVDAEVSRAAEEAQQSIRRDQNGSLGGLRADLERISGSQDADDGKDEE